LAIVIIIKQLQFIRMNLYVDVVQSVVERSDLFS
jgi:hypothetical protein